MDVKEAVATAKKYFAEVFEGEGSPPTLEEVWFDSEKGEWCITMGVLRQAPSSKIFDPLGRENSTHYKTVRISDETGQPISIRNREAA